MSLQAAVVEYPIVHLKRTYQVSADRMFRAWTRANELSRWFGPEGVIVTDARVDLKIGGVMTLTMNMPDGGQTRLKTVYREIILNERLVFTWQWLSPSCEGSREVEEETLVTVNFRPLADGGTEVDIVHEGLPTQSARDSHKKGWNGCLDCLQISLA